MSQDIVQLPHTHIGHLEGEDLKAAIERNFKEIAHMLRVLQMYEKKVGKPINEVVDGATDSDGYLLTEMLNEKMVGLQNELQLAAEAVTEAKLAVADRETVFNVDDSITVTTTVYWCSDVYFE